jgi:hypothetical protein
MASHRAALNFTGSLFAGSDNKFVGLKDVIYRSSHPPFVFISFFIGLSFSIPLPPRSAIGP